MSRLLNRLSGRVYGWFVSKDARSHSRIAVRKAWSPLALATLEDRITPVADFMVLNTNDSGSGSLRQALSDATAAANVGGSDTVSFNTNSALGVDFSAGLHAIPLLSTILNINDSVTINGPGADKLVITRGTTAAVNQAITFGGAARTFIVNDLAISGFSGTGAGGGIGAQASTTAGSVFTLQRVTISGNTTSGTGGGLYVGNGTVNILGCTIAGNTSTSTAGGGGVRFSGTVAGNVVNIENSTITGNSTASDGGGISFNVFAGTVNLRNTTISGNTAVGSATAGTGGAISRTTTTSAVTLNIQSSIVAGNVSNTADISIGATNTTVTPTNSVVGTTRVGTNPTTGTATNPLLSLLGYQNNSATTGRTPVVIPLSGSPAINKQTTGTAPGGTTDQTGASRSTLPFEAGSTEDLGSAPFVMIPALPNIFSAGGTTYNFSAFVYNVNPATLGNNDLRISYTTVGGTSSVLANYVANSYNAVTGQADYTFTPPGGSFSSGDTGYFNVTVESGAILSPSSVPVPVGFEGAFVVNLPTPVTTGTFPTVAAQGSAPYRFTINYGDIAGGVVNAATIGTGDILVTGPGGFSQLATVVAPLAGAQGNTQTVTYQITPPSGAWAAGNNGQTYNVALVGGEVGVSAGDFLPANASVGTFLVAYGQTLVVDTIADDASAGSLRTLIGVANTDPLTPDTITFSPAVFGTTAQTITLGSALPQITGDLTISNTNTPRVILASSINQKILDIISASRVSTVTVNNVEIAGTTGFVAVSTDNENVTLSNVKISGVTGTVASGGAISVGAAGILSLVGSELTNNRITGTGAGINAGNGANVTVTNSRITNNSASTGGGINTGSAAFVTVVGSTMDGNTAGSTTGGGGIAMNNGGLQSLYVVDSTLSNNVILGTSGNGGAILFTGNVAPRGVLVRNSTLSGNSAVSGGGIRFNTLGGTANIQNSTITNNTSTTTSTGVGLGGGGVQLISVSGSGTVDIVSSIVSGNVSNAANGADDIAAVTTNAFVNASFSAIGTTKGYTLTGNSNNLTGGLETIGSLALGTLANNGGTTLTHKANPGSSAIEKGSNPSAITPALAFDQTGAARVQQGGGGAAVIDIGSFEARPAPAAVASGLVNITTANAATSSPYFFFVTYTDANAIDYTSIQGDEITVTRDKGGFSATATLVNYTATMNAASIQAKYSVTPTGGSWNGSDFNGNYTVSILGNQVKNAGSEFITPATVGVFNVNLPATFVVTNTGDNGGTNPAAFAGTGTLRQALVDANATLGTLDTIIFGGSVFMTGPNTIALGNEILINDSVLIDGNLTKADLLVSGGGTKRLFNITDGIAGNLLNVTIRDLTLTSASSSGGAVTIVGENVTFERTAFDGNKTSASGGAINFTTPGNATLTILDSSFTGNSANTDGGVINITNAVAGATPSLVVRNSSFTANTADADGGALNIGSALTPFNILVENSLFESNITGQQDATGDGAAVYFRGTVGANGVIFRNSTVSGNSAGALTTNTASVSAALAFPLVAGTVQIQNCTLTKNTASSTSTEAGDGGGAIAITGTSSGLSIESSVVSGNSSLGGRPDIASANAVKLVNSAVGSAAGFSTTTDSAGNLAFGTTLKLADLANNGGPTRTHLPAADSPLIDRGSNPANQATDQRGSGFPRVISLTDIGAVEAGGSATTVAIPGGLGKTITNPNATPFTFTVTYGDADGIDWTSLSSDDLQVTGPNGFSVNATKTAVDVPSNGSPRTATYTVAAPGAMWTGADTGFYTVNLVAGKVLDALGNPNSAATLGSFAVAVAATTLTVTNVNDSGSGSLRDAIAAANLAPTADTIAFAPSFSTGTSVITLADQLRISEPVSINGPGADHLGVSGNDLYRVFSILNTSSQIAVGITGLTIRNGFVDTGFQDGGGIDFNGEDLTLTEVHVLNNKSNGNHGGGIASNIGGGKLTIIRSTLSGNSALSNGGAIFMNNTGGGSVLTVTNSTIANNKAATGGAFSSTSWNATGTMTLTQSTIAGNTATTTAGIRVATGAVITLAGSIVTNAPSGGTNPDFGLTPTLDASDSIIGSTAGATLSGTSTNNQVGVDPQLQPLANNGGPTPTMAILDTSPAYNAGPATSALATDQRGFARLVGSKVDVGAYEAAASTAPVVAGFTINGGAGQRSRINSIEVTFAANLTASQFASLQAANAITLINAETGAGTAVVKTGGAGTVTEGTITVSASATADKIVLTFAGAPAAQPTDLRAVDYASLSDGKWRLEIAPASYVSDPTFQPTPGSFPQRIWRLFGDLNGDGTVDGANDGASFGFGSTATTPSLAPFDFNNDGTIDGGTDYSEFGSRFGRTVA